MTLNPLRWGGRELALETAERPGRARRYASLFRRSLHVKFALANFVCGILPDFASGVIRGRVYRWAGFDVGDGAFLMGNLSLKSASPGFYENLSIGEGATIADHVTINLDAKVTIGRNGGIAPHVLIYTGSHEIGPGSMRIGPFTAFPVTIGQGAVVAAGAVVLKDVPPNTYVEGNPAQVVRKLPWGYR